MSSIRYSVELDTGETKNKLKILAATHNITIKEAIKQAVIQWIERNTKNMIK